LAAAIKASLDAEVQLLPSSGGCFEVVADGELVFSKNRVGRFPTDEEVLLALNG
jgi:selT/selW/selH-like putative selenoprotein